MKTFRLAGASVNQTPLDWKNNVDNIIASIRSAKKEKVDILCLPELCLTAYGCQDLFLSKWLADEAQSYLQPIIDECEEILVTVGLPLYHNNLSLNCVVVIENKKIIGISAKQHMARDGVHYEPRWFDPWPAHKKEMISFLGSEVLLGDIIYDFKGIKIAFEICEDAWRDTRPAHNYKKQGVHLILNPSASHFAMGKTHDRDDLVINSSKDFNCTYVYANLLGNDAGRMIYDGEILIAKEGNLINRNKWLSFKPYNLIFSDIDFDLPGNKHNTAPEFNRSKEQEFVQAVSLGLFDYLRKSHSKGFVLSLSGGADSSCCAVLISEMVKRGVQELGEEKFCHEIGRPDLVGKNLMKGLLTCAYQSTKHSSSETFRGAALLANELGAEFYSWSVDAQVNEYTNEIEKVIGKKLSWEENDIALQNIQARARSPIIWMLANLNQALLITTSNRSEGDVGYATMDGDTSGSIAPIAGVDKSFIRKWLLWAEKYLGYESLSHINALVPTAELRPPGNGQSDEKDLMPYDLLLQIERLAIKDKKSPREVFSQLNENGGYEPEYLKASVKKFFEMWAKNQWKRERLAPSFHLDDFSVDPKSWSRYPILCNPFIHEIKKLDD